MTTFNLPAIMCDHEAGCDQYAEDVYATGATSVTYLNGDVFLPRSTEPALGWVRRDDEDFCPEHAEEQQAIASMRAITKGAKP